MKSKLRVLLCLLYAALVLLIVLTYKVMSDKAGQVSFVYVLLVAFITVITIRIHIWLNDYVIKPMDKLKKGIREIEKGNFDYILDTDQDSELGDVCGDFDKMRISLKEKFEEHDKIDRENKELISNITHDLKTPLTAIRGYAEGITDGVVTTPDQLDRYVRTISTKAADMSILIDELTYYTKIDTNRIPYHFDRLSPVEFFADCAEDVGMDLENRGIEFSYINNVDPDVTIIADAEQIKRVVNNIISNAVKYLDKTPGRIQIRLLDDGDFIKVEIEDNGKGIAAEDLQYLFERFYRTDSSRNSNTGGSGIGLSIANKIIEDHGGRIWARSKLGEGSTFVFIIRKHQEPNR